MLPHHAALRADHRCRAAGPPAPNDAQECAPRRPIQASPCRALPAGRRIRHKTAQQKLAEWQAEAKERELEKVAMRHLKEAAKKQRQEEREQVGAA